MYNSFVFGGGSGGPPPENFDNLLIKWCILRHSDDSSKQTHAGKSKLVEILTLPNVLDPTREGMRKNKKLGITATQSLVGLYFPEVRFWTQAHPSRNKLQLSKVLGVRQCFI